MNSRIAYARGAGAVVLATLVAVAACSRDAATGPRAALRAPFPGTYALIGVPSAGAVSPGTGQALVGEVVSVNATGDYYGVQYFASGPVEGFSSQGHLIGSDALELGLHGTYSLAQFAVSNDTSFSYVDQWGIWRYVRIAVQARASSTRPNDR